MRVRYTPAAREHLKEIAECIVKDNRVAANRVLQAIRQAVDMLRDHP